MLEELVTQAFWIGLLKIIGVNITSPATMPW